MYKANQSTEVLIRDGTGRGLRLCMAFRVASPVNTLDPCGMAPGHAGAFENCEPRIRAIGSTPP